MNERPMLHKILNSKTFMSYYYLKQELVVFCRQEGLQITGGKEELTDRVAYYLIAGKNKTSKQPKKPSRHIAEISEDSIIEEIIVCSEQHRAFFKLFIGDGFSFNVLFQKWLKSNAGKTYKDAIESYYQILEDKKTQTTKIAKVFEYNTYIRDFFKDNCGKSLEDAIKCWKYKKSKQGHNRYEKEDLKNGLGDSCYKITQKQLEVDFVCNKGNQRYYVQSAFSIPKNEKMQQEQTSLIHISDSFKRTIIEKKI